MQNRQMVPAVMGSRPSVQEMFISYAR